MKQDSMSKLEEFLRSAQGQAELLKLSQELWDRAQREREIEHGDIISGKSSEALHGVIRRWALAPRDARWN